MDVPTVVALIGGGLVALLGVYMLVTGDCRALHGYHVATTPAAERPILAREVGACTVILGISVALVCQTSLPDMATVVGVVLLVIGIAGMFAAIIRHNGGLITVAPGYPGPGIAGFGPRGTMVTCAVVGALLSLIGFVPGAYLLVTGDVSLLHGYHYVNVAAADLPALATGEGLAMMGLGVAILACMVATGGMAAWRPAPRWSKVLMGVGAVLFAACLVATLLVIMRYNGSLMGN